MKVTSQDIDKRKSELEEESRIKYEAERRKIRVELTDKLSRGKYYGILEMAEKYDIKLPHDHLRKAADLYSKRGGSRKLILAQWAYKQLEDEENAESLNTKIQREINRESAIEMYETMFR